MPVLVIGGAELLWLAIAIVALLLTLALSQLVTWLSYVFPNFHVPVLGSLRGQILNAIRGSISLVTRAAQGSFAFMIHVLMDPVSFFMHFINSINAVFSELIASINWVRHTLVPGLISTARRDLSAATTAVQHEAEHLYNLSIGAVNTAVQTSEHYADKVSSAVQGEAEHLYNLSIAYVDNSIIGIEGDLAAAVTKVESYADTAASAVRSEAEHLYNLAVGSGQDAATAALNAANGAIGQVARDAQTAANLAAAAALTTLEGEAARALAGVWPDVSAAAQGVISTAGTDFAGAISDIKAIDWTKTVDIAGSIAGTAAIAASMAKLAEQCVIPNCRNLSGIGRELQQILGAVEGAGFLAFITEMLTNPAGAATEARDILVPVFEDTYTTAKHLIGI